MLPFVCNREIKSSLACCGDGQAPPAATAFVERGAACESSRQQCVVVARLSCVAMIVVAVMVLIMVAIVITDSCPIAARKNLLRWNALRGVVTLRHRHGTPHCSFSSSMLSLRTCA
jgi:hypothetical protein